MPLFTKDHKLNQDFLTQIWALNLHLPTKYPILKQLLLSPFLTLATLSGRAAIAFPHTQWKWQCHQLDATPNRLYKLSWAGKISVARSRWLIEAQASRWLLGEKWSISQQEEWAEERKQALREQKLHWCERAAQLPAAGASLNIHISNNLELYVVQTGRVTSR